ncbi:hypothetical protein HPB52_018215 [Rhipicephalus sanguineus]|uniref:Cytochrome P450 n=1 Tax=Rhipicephalus sanguineus TaxID=34632 RepID=A0A9D4PKB5_RHISA|nr:hypothetical protein HPB52_018215 [Rhipicephalus sanguineus]
MLQGFVHAITDWCAKYGDIFGFYNGDLPMLVVKDLDFLTYVFVKEFKNFTDRGVLIRTDQEHAVLSNSIVHAKGAEWKRARSCMSQAFTSNKLRHMMQDLVESADLFIETLGDLADAGQELAIHEPLQGLAMDYTGRAAFGLDCCFQRNPSHPFMQAARQVIHGVMTGPFHMIAPDSRKKTSMTLQEVELNTTMTMFAGFTTRRAINDFEYNGVKYKAGTSIMAPTMNIHMDHRYWLEPHKFDPERYGGDIDCSVHKKPEEQAHGMKRQRGHAEVIPPGYPALEGVIFDYQL